MFARIKTNYETSNGNTYNDEIIRSVMYVISNFIAGTTPAIDTVISYGGFTAGNCRVESVSGNPVTAGMYNIQYEQLSSSGLNIIQKKHSQMLDNAGYMSIIIYPYTYNAESSSYGFGVTSALHNSFPSNNTAVSHYYNNAYQRWNGFGSIASNYYPEYIDIHMTDTTFAIWVSEKRAGGNDKSAFFVYTDLEYIPAIDDAAALQNSYYCPCVAYSTVTDTNASLTNVASTSAHHFYHAPQQWSYELDGFVNAVSYYGTPTSVGSTNLYSVDPILPFPTFGHAPLPTGDGYYSHMLIPMMYGGGEQTEIPRRMLGVARTSNDTFYHGETILNGTEKWVAAPNVAKTPYPVPFEGSGVYNDAAFYLSHGAWAFKQQPTV